MTGANFLSVMASFFIRSHAEETAAPRGRFLSHFLQTISLSIRVRPDSVALDIR